MQSVVGRRSCMHLKVPDLTACSLRGVAIDSMAGWNC